MRAIHFDPFSGASGDMMLAALADAGADLAGLEAALERSLPFDVTLRAERIERRGLTGTRVRVEAPEEHPPHRRLRDILDILATPAVADLPTPVRERSERTFTLLARAEAAVHGTSVDEVHFHELGAADTIVDVVGAHWLVNDLARDSERNRDGQDGQDCHPAYPVHPCQIPCEMRVTSGPVAVGSGTVTCAHGVLPVPAPATAKLLEGVPVVGVVGGGGGGETGELTTPTGAALLVVLAASFGPVPPMVLERAGYGFGSREREDGPPNALRVLLGETGPAADREADKEEVAVLETTVDDMPGEWIGHLHGVLSRAGALEVSTVAVGMKKSRPGVRVTVVARVEDARSLAEALLRETTSFGVRFRTERRLVLDRETVEVETPWGTARVKVGRLPATGASTGMDRMDGMSPASDPEHPVQPCCGRGDVVQASPEYEDCARLAESAGVPLGTVYEAALAAYRRGR